MNRKAFLFIYMGTFYIFFPVLYFFRRDIFFPHSATLIANH